MSSSSPQTWLECCLSYFEVLNKCIVCIQNSCLYMIFDASMAVKVNICVSCVMISCRPVGIYQRFGETYWLHLQSRRKSFPLNIFCYLLWLISEDYNPNINLQFGIWNNFRDLSWRIEQEAEMSPLYLGSWELVIFRLIRASVSEKGFHFITERAVFILMVKRFEVLSTATK
jgi:hypothetical protein